MSAGYRIGDQVKKRVGYNFDSEVVAVFDNLAGQERLICESVMIPGLLHIFSPNQMYIVGKDNT